MLGTIKMEKLWERNFALSRSSQVRASGKADKLIEIVFQSNFPAVFKLMFLYSV